MHAGSERMYLSLYLTPSYDYPEQNQQQHSICSEFR